MANVDVDINAIVDNLIIQIANLSKENAILKAQIQAMNTEQNKNVEEEK